jgi:hypothetical protein
MKASEMTLEERVAYEAQLADRFERVAQINEDLAQRAEFRRETGADIDELYEETSRRREVKAPVPQPRPAPARQATTMDAETAADWNRWCDKRSVDLLKIYDESIVGDVRKAFLEAREISRTEQRAAIDELRAEITRSETAICELFMGLEKRFVDLERDVIRKPQKPRLVGSGGDGAA